MATNTNSREIVQFLSTTPEPLWLLQYLRDDPSPIDEITNALLLPQNDIQPALDELIERDWAERTTEGYRITTLGAFVTMEYLAFLDTLEEIYDSKQFIQSLPLEAISPFHSGSFNQ